MIRPQLRLKMTLLILQVNKCLKLFESIQSLLAGQRLVLHRGTIEKLVLGHLFVALIDRLRVCELLQLLGLSQVGLAANILAGIGLLVNLLSNLA